MINKNSIEAIDTSLWQRDFHKPLYTGYSFYCLPNTIKAVFGVSATPSLINPLLPEEAFELSGCSSWSDSQFSNVVLMLIDGLGWRFWNKYLTERLSSAVRLEQRGVLSSLSSCFPSTTALHVTNIATGQSGGESGVYEWFVYEPSLNKIIAPLPFCLAGADRPDCLVDYGLTVEKVFPSRTIFEELAGNEVESYSFQDRHICNSICSRALGKGSELVPFSGLKEGLSKLRHVLFESPTRRKYCYFYYHQFDSQCHHDGPHSSSALSLGKSVLKQIDDFVTSLKSLSEKGRTLLLICADHGHTEVDPRTTVFINQTIPQIVEMIELGADNRPLVPAGSARDLFLHIKPQYVAESIELLSNRLEDRAEVHRVEELIDLGFFGPVVSPLFRSRVGNVVILPHSNHTVWWYEKDRFGMNFLGHHGGLTANELTSALLSVVI